MDIYHYSLNILNLFYHDNIILTIAILFENQACHINLRFSKNHRTEQVRSRFDCSAHQTCALHHRDTTIPETCH